MDTAVSAGIHTVAHHAHLAGIAGKSLPDGGRRFLSFFLGVEIPYTQAPGEE